MKTSKSPLFRMLAAIGFGCIFFVGLSFAQTVTIAHKYSGGSTVPATASAPVAASYLEATPSSPSTVLSVVIYKNDVPIATITSSPFTVNLGQLGQDSYTFRARAFYPSNVQADSSELKFTAYSPAIYKMGTNYTIGSTGVTLSGPGRWRDHTSQIQNAVNAISANNGGTLFFPCTFGTKTDGGDPDIFSIYVIKSTIYVPANVTLQGEGGGDTGPCQIWWHDPTYNTDPCGAQPTNMDNKPMFQVIGNSTRVRFRDLALRAMGGGVNCYYGRRYNLVDRDGTTGIKITTNGIDPNSSQARGDVSDVLLENVTITQFTHGISAFSTESYKVHDIKVRGALLVGNHRDFYIDAPTAYNWDVQSIDTLLNPSQAALEIINSGTPSGYTEGLGDLRFLQLNCAGGPKRGDLDPITHDQLPPSQCIRINKHGGLYFKQVHVEGPQTALIVEKLSGAQTNDKPIVLEASVIAGEFKDASMKLYMIGSFLGGAPEIPEPTFWDSKMHFQGDGLLSKVVDCGNIFGDRTDTDGIPGDPPAYFDWQMQFTHTERQRPGYYDVTNSFDVADRGYEFKKEPVSCPAGRDDGIPDTTAIGGAYFDTGTMPTETGVLAAYTNSVSCTLSVCDHFETAMAAALGNANGGAVVVSGNWEATDEVMLPSYRMIVGVPGSVVTLTSSNKSLFKRTVGFQTTGSPPVIVPIDARSMVMRDLTLKAGSSLTGTTAIRFTNTGICTWVNGDPDPNDIDCRLGGATDFHFSGLNIEGFDTGFFGGRIDINTPEIQLDSIGFRSLTFVNNKTAVEIESSNASNWNIPRLEMQSNTSNAKGWYQKNGGHQSFQNTKCSGVSGTPMASCLRFETTGAAVLDLKKGSYVTNMVHIESPLDFFGTMTGNLLIRDSDLTSSTANTSMFYINGKIFMTSINNRYKYFNPGTDNEWNLSRVTYCGDDFNGGTQFPGLDNLYDNLNFGIHMPTRLACGKQNSKPWQEPFKWGGKNSTDTPLAGNFYDDVQEDFVVYQRDSQSKFIIHQGAAPGPSPSPSPTKEVSWGLPTDVPLVGRFLTSTPRSQVVAYRTGTWYAKDPNTSSEYYFYWGTTGDVPFVGNFFEESGGASAQRDEIAIYRPSSHQVWIQDPRNPSVYKTIYLGGDKGSQIQVGNFLGVENEQFAMFDDQTGKWYIVDANPSTPATSTINFGGAGDIAVAGKFLPTLEYSNCTQLGVWHPGSGTWSAGEEEITIRDPSSACGGRGFYPNETLSWRWGSNNDYGSSSQLDDVPLTINTANGLLDRFAAYRPTAGHFQYSKQNGLWFVHDPF